MNSKAPNLENKCDLSDFVYGLTDDNWPSTEAMLKFMIYTFREANYVCPEALPMFQFIEHYHSVAETPYEEMHTVKMEVQRLWIRLDSQIDWGKHKIWCSFYEQNGLDWERAEREIQWSFNDSVKVSQYFSVRALFCLFTSYDQIAANYEPFVLYAEFMSSYAWVVESEYQCRMIDILKECTTEYVG